MDNYNKLIEHLKQYNKLCIAFSGGADSTFLLRAAKEALGDNVFAIVADTAFFAKSEIEFAVNLAKELGATCYVIDADVLEIPQITYNEHNRCYHCKYTIFSGIAKIASLYGTKTIADGRIVTDTTEYRPGHTASQELGVVSPLLECGFSKEDVRAMSKELGLPTWNKPTNSCLATRFPYDTELSIQKLRMVELGENYLKTFGVGVLRLRTHEDVARIEVSSDEFNLILDNAADITAYIKELGYKYVTLDLTGFRSGSMDESR